MNFWNHPSPHTDEGLIDFDRKTKVLEKNFRENWVTFWRLGLYTFMPLKRHEREEFYTKNCRQKFHMPQNVAKTPKNSQDSNHEKVFSASHIKFSYTKNRVYRQIMFNDAEFNAKTIEFSDSGKLNFVGGELGGVHKFKFSASGKLDIVWCSEFSDVGKLGHLKTTSSPTGENSKIDGKLGRKTRDLPTSKYISQMRAIRHISFH